MPSKKSIPDTYKEFIVVQCSHCGETSVFYSENKIGGFVRKHCNKQI